MRTAAPPLAPLFRSEHQLALLAELFAGATHELTIAELARRIGANDATVSREVERLVRVGLLSVRVEGRNKLVRADYRLPWAGTLRQLLVETAGALPVLGAALGAVAGVRSAWVFGSWAARYLGEPGPFPRDVDLLVVGEPDQVALYGALVGVERQIGLEVHPVVVTAAEWESPASDSFLAEVQAGPLVPVAMASDDR
jgi:DNA-binding transcriptional ArsR family regulator